MKYHPKEISEKILKQLKKDIINFLKEEIKDGIIIVPAYFNNTQRYETIGTAKIAGLNIIQIINETTGVPIAYGFQQNSENKKNRCF